MAAVTDREIHELGGQLRASANAWAACDGSFDERAATRLRHHAIARCHAYYRATIPAYLEDTIAALRTDPEMARDRTALARACCTTRVPELLKRAPKPQIAVNGV